MSSRVSSSSLLLGLGLLLVVGMMVVLRFQNPGTTVSPSDVAPVVDPSASVPEFTSATFVDGDLMKGLGPEWTYLRASELEPNDARAVSGTVPDRESVVKLVGEPVEMTLAEYDIEDPQKLDTALASLPTASVGDRSGWLVPLNDIAGGKGFLLKGSRSVLLISLSTSAEWPTELPSAVTSFIVAIRVP